MAGLCAAPGRVFLLSNGFMGLIKKIDRYSHIQQGFIVLHFQINKKKDKNNNLADSQKIKAWEGAFHYGVLALSV